MFWLTINGYSTLLWWSNHRKRKNHQSLCIINSYWLNDDVCADRTWLRRLFKIEKEYLSDWYRMMVSFNNIVGRSAGLSFENWASASVTRMWHKKENSGMLFFSKIYCTIILPWCTISNIVSRIHVHHTMYMSPYIVILRNRPGAMANPAWWFVSLSRISSGTERPLCVCFIRDRRRAGRNLRSAWRTAYGGIYRARPVMQVRSRRSVCGGGKPSS